MSAKTNTDPWDLAVDHAHALRRIVASQWAEGNHPYNIAKLVENIAEATLAIERYLAYGRENKS